MSENSEKKTKQTNKITNHETTVLRGYSGVLFFSISATSSVSNELVSRLLTNIDHNMVLIERIFRRLKQTFP